MGDEFCGSECVKGDLVKRASVVVDLGFGDAGKGSLVDFLTRESFLYFNEPPLIIRFNGGAQAAHNVVTVDGTWHTFSQFGSGSLIRGVVTYLSKYMVVDPPALENEAWGLLRVSGNPHPYRTLYVDRAAPIITSYHIRANQLRERARGNARHGSCGRGVGEVIGDMLTGLETIVAGDLEQYIFHEKLEAIRRRKEEEFGTELFSDISFEKEVRTLLRLTAGPQLVDEEVFLSVNRDFKGKILFEGAQGILIDEWHGFHPYTSWSNCTSDNALVLAEGLGLKREEIEVIGAVRAYMCRHGRGPFPTEGVWPWKETPKEAHNGTNFWQEHFRFGLLDTVLLKYAIDCCTSGVDLLAISHLDKFKNFSLCYGYADRESLFPNFEKSLELQQKITDALFSARPAQVAKGLSEAEFVQSVSTYLGTPPGILSRGLTAMDKERIR